MGAGTTDRPTWAAGATCFADHGPSDRKHRRVEVREPTPGGRTRGRQSGAAAWTAGARRRRTAAGGYQILRRAAHRAAGGPLESAIAAAFNVTRTSAVEGMLTATLEDRVRARRGRSEAEMGSSGRIKVSSPRPRRRPRCAPLARRLGEESTRDPSPAAQEGTDVRLLARHQRGDHGRPPRSLPRHGREVARHPGGERWPARRHALPFLLLQTRLGRKKTHRAASGCRDLRRLDALALPQGDQVEPRCAWRWRRARLDSRTFARRLRRLALRMPRRDQLR